MATNDFVPFAIGGGANVQTPSVYAANPLLPTGNVAGVASSIFNNTALRQANFVASQFAQFLANQTQTNVQDNGVAVQLLSQINAVLMPLPPVMTALVSSGTWNPTFYFFCASANATTGATYTNNSVTFTVSSTISGGVLLAASGAAAPTVSGVLTKASGTGDAAITFYAVRAPLYCKYRMAGGGGGGGGSSNSIGAGGGGAGAWAEDIFTAAAAAITITIGTGGGGGSSSGGSGGLGAGGGNGNSSSIGAPVNVTCGGGSGGEGAGNGQTGGAGGTITSGTPLLNGTGHGGPGNSPGSTGATVGGAGGSSLFGGAGTSGVPGSVPIGGESYGAGGGGAGNGENGAAGGGGVVEIGAFYQ